MSASAPTARSARSTTFEAHEAVLAKEIADAPRRGISASGERPDTYPSSSTCAVPDQFRKLIGLLAARGYSSRRIEKIMGLNFLRHAESVWGG